ncbi:phosphonate C-P lyase system protein PhnL [Acidisoma cellulosilytica]|uniref:Phosphonate C-P lyase system protein PhnL n=2 Tax=Acidisoma cellulosilyticum TaxID=2802395 RepID=A0A963Z118_9PROT|nr:phosphonate C-P lyase system protein PhnL [Acidisoma cellulosilyticum]MCB8880554.1 phosphonate C-P lyase system protein PhnL [Acidisoma cellulosilyticum]
MNTAGHPMLKTHGLSKSFTLHLQGGTTMPVLENVELTVNSGECVVLSGPSGAGKSTLMRSLYGNYRVGQGSILIRHRDDWVDLAQADPRRILAVRRDTLGYVSQFLRVVPRVPTIEIVAEALTIRGADHAEAITRARSLLLRLNLPERLHGLPPATFSGGEQQRVNLARGFIGGHPILLLDEPTASLDAINRDAVVGLVAEAKAAGTAILGIVHDTPTRDAIADRLFKLYPAQMAAA